MKVLLIVLLLISAKTFAASCCGGGAGLPTLITGDFRAQVGVTLSKASIVARTYESGKPVFYSDNKEYESTTTKMAAGYQFDNFIQLGAETSFVQKSHQENTVEENEKDIGDTSFSITYEFMPETFYSLWVPRGFVFLKQVIPTGKSNFETQTKTNSDVTGKGFYTTSLGLVFYKIINDFDVLYTVEAHKNFKEEFSNNTVSSSYGGSTALSMGYSPKQSNFRVGFDISPKYEGKKDISLKTSTISTSSEYYWDTGISASYMLKDFSINGTYTDQTLLGPTKNTTLSRTIALTFQKRWSL